MAAGDWIERAITRTRAAEETEIHEIVRTIRVVGYGPDEAYENANPRLPALGTIFPFASARSLNATRASGMRLPRLTRIRSNYIKGEDIKGSDVSLVYTLGPRLFGPRGEKYVQWEARSGIEFEEVTHDNSGQPIPSGGTIAVSIVNYTARIIGWSMLFAHEFNAGTVNASTFRGWPPRWVRFDGATASLMDAWDVRGGAGYGSVIELSFQAKYNGWDERRPHILEDGTAETSGEGLVYVTRKTMQESEFSVLFPSVSGGQRWITGI